jgi:hypothetical protein
LEQFIQLLHSSSPSGLPEGGLQRQTARLARASIVPEPVTARPVTSR